MIHRLTCGVPFDYAQASSAGLGSIAWMADAALEAPLFHVTSRVRDDSQGGLSATFERWALRTSSEKIPAKCSAACATVEERPFQGRVNGRKLKRALAPVVVFFCGSRGRFTGAKALPSRDTLRGAGSAALPRDFTRP